MESISRILVSAYICMSSKPKNRHAATYMHGVHITLLKHRGSGENLERHVIVFFFRKTLSLSANSMCIPINVGRRIAC